MEQRLSRKKVAFRDETGGDLEYGPSGQNTQKFLALLPSILSRRPTPQLHSDRSIGSSRLPSLEPEDRSAARRLIEGALERAGKMGQKKAVTEVWKHSEEILENCKLELLFKAFAEPSIIKSEDGIKFAALVVPKLGEAIIWRILTTKIVGGRLTKSDLNNYGEVIARACKNASGDEKKLKAIGREIIKPVIDAAINATESISSNLLENFVFSKNCKFQILEPLSTKRFTKGSNLNGVLYLAAKQPLLRQLDEPGRNLEILKEQAKWMQTCLEHRNFAVKLEAIKQLFKVLSLNYALLDRAYRAETLAKMVKMTLTDGNEQIRLAFVSGLNRLCVVPETNTLIVKILERVVDFIEEPRENVRLQFTAFIANFQKRIKKYEFDDLLPIKRIFTRMMLETSAKIQPQLAQIIFQKYGLLDSNMKEVQNYVFQMSQFGRVPVLRYYSSLVKADIVKVHQAVSHIRILAMCVGKILMKDRRHDDDITDSEATGNDSAKERIKVEEDSPASERHLFTLEMIITLTNSLQKMKLHSAEDEFERNCLDKILEALFKRLFKMYSNTSLLGATMAIGCLLRGESAKKMAATIIGVLRKGDFPDNFPLGASIEMAARGDVKGLVGFIGEGLDVIPELIKRDDTPISSPIKKRPRVSSSDENLLEPDGEIKDDEMSEMDDAIRDLQRSFEYLKLLISSETCQLIFKGRAEALDGLEEIFKKLKPLNQLVTKFLNRMAKSNFPSMLRTTVFSQKDFMDLLIDGIRIKHTIAIQIHAFEVGQCIIASRIDLMKIWSAELAWFQEKITPNAEFEEQPDTMISPARRTTREGQMLEANCLAQDILSTILDGSNYAVKFYERLTDDSSRMTDLDVDRYEVRQKFLLRIVELLDLPSETAFLPPSFMVPYFTLAENIVQVESEFPDDIWAIYMDFIQFAPKWIKAYSDRFDVKEISAIALSYESLMVELTENRQLQLNDEIVEEITAFIAKRVVARVVERREDLFASDEGPLECLKWDRCLQILLDAAIFACRRIFRSFMALFYDYVQAWKWEREKNRYQFFVAVTVLLKYVDASAKPKQFKGKI
ncbi:hypothetical protein WR25_26500 isoform A [Diploscapter pachys]|uniref:Uncharacterized protein n=1 Tax=Diploscapter pachys TaxID=2018661 RepID=A0A2A2LIW9_9BILA|nr:hypothetical protein WR25_26500 isoform A [Diploscapter pachys]